MKKILVAAALGLFASNAMADEVMKWAWEDGNSDGAWNYSESNWNFETFSWANIPTTGDAYQGSSALSFNYLNRDLDENGSHTQAFAFALIHSGNTAQGSEPNNPSERDAGKDLTQFTHLEFYIKGSEGINQSAAKVYLRSPNGHGSVQVNLRNYVNVNQGWQKVVIPLSDLRPQDSNPNYFQIFNVTAVGFYVDQNNANVPFNFKVDNVSFVKVGATTPVDGGTRRWWSEDADHNNEYNYSTTAMSGGSSLNVANQWGDVVISNYMTGPMGNSPIPSIDMNFQHNGSGYAEANLNTSATNNGHEPVDFADRDVGKYINGVSALRFAAPGIMEGVKVKLVDQNGNSSEAVSINQYRGSYGRYTFDFSIPVFAFNGSGFNYNAVKSVTFFVDGSTPAGNYPLKVINLRFEPMPI